MANPGLRLRLRIAAVASLLVAVSALLVALGSAASARTANRELSERLVPAAGAAGDLLAGYTAQQLSLRDYVTTGRSSSLDAYQQVTGQIPQLAERVSGLVADYPGMPRLLAAAQAAHQDWLTKVAGPELAAVGGGNQAAAQAMQAAGISRGPVLAMRSAIAGLQAQVTAAQAASAAHQAGAQRLLLFVLLGTVVLVVTNILLVLVIVRRWLLRPFDTLRRAADQVAAGDHDTRIPLVGPAELVELGRSMEAMRSRLVAVLAEREAAERGYRELLEAAPDATVQVAADGLIQSVNGQAERLFGYPRSELVGRPVEVLVPPRARETHPGHRAHYFSRPRNRPMGAGLQLTAVHRDGHEIPVEISLSTVQTERGPVVSAAIRDVTERRQAEQALRAQQAYTEAILRTAGDAYVSIDSTGVVTDWNLAAEQIFGWGAEEAVGRQVADMIVPAELRETYLAAMPAGLAEIGSGGMGRRFEVTAQHRDGRRIPVEASIWRGGTEGCPQFHAFLHDISERLALQAEREQAKVRAEVQAEREQHARRLQQSERLESLGQLAGGVAHDFNNLLAVIVNYLGFVAEDLDAAAADDPQRWTPTRSDVEQVQRAAERATALTRQLLAFGRRDIAKPQVLDLNHLVGDVEQLLRRTLGERISLVTRPAPSLWRVVADAGQVEQVLLNLAVNARDAMPTGGTLTIDTDNVTVDDDYLATHPNCELGRHVRMRVSDTGTGMTREVSEKAFEPFFTTKGKGEGTGLGLATVYGIVTQAGGHAQIYSEPGMGATISVLLPATEDELAGAEAEDLELEPARGDGQTVLLAEDEDALREVTTRILTRNGYQVIAAADGPEALQLAAGHDGPIDVLVTDVVMPHMLGRELATTLAAVRPDTPVLYISGYAQPVLATNGTLDPDVVLLEKPFSEHALLAHVRRVLTGG